VVIISVAWRGPVAVGVKLMLMEHVELAPAFGGKNGCGEHIDGATKSLGSAPETITVATARGELPVFVTVKAFGPAVCPTLTLPKS
jgi:hypothetical protein